MKNIGSNAELNSTLSSAGSRLVVVDFFATWCGPCKTLAPILDGLERKHTSTVFAKVDVDQAQDCSSQYRVTAMPTILFFKNKSEVGRVVGADVGKIQSLIKTYEGGSSFSGSGQTLGGGGNTLGGANSPAGKASGSSSSGAKKGNLDDAPYHVRLLTAVGHLSSGIMKLCTSLLRNFVYVAGAAKTGLLGDGAKAGNEERTVESPGGSCQIQIRMLDGTSIRGDFEPEHTLKTVHEFVKATMDARGVKAPGFSLMTNFPKTVYKDEGLQQTLDEAKLTPRAQLIVLAA
ncbi:thioredoxin 1 [Entomortierella parvispora]|uniref:Thioredoxin 1 n=1 Tax=Entomortierella parvispora TaxID=205924 RepID=A0A9P3HGN4_9FUNG|nr:thioredoxin 1 [Entomortierella parvispora]